MPAEERSRVILVLVAHAAVFLLLTAAEATWVLAAAVRLWRRRENGLTAAARAGVHQPTLVALLIAHLAYIVLRRIGLAKFCQRTSHYAVQQGESG